MWTWKQINKNRHISLEKYMTTSILLTFKLHHWKYKFSNTSASFMVRSSLANYSKTKGKRGCENRRRLLKFIMKIKSNTTNKDLYLDVSVSIRGLRQKKMALALIIIEFRIIEITTTLRLSENQRIWYKFSGFVFSCLLASARVHWHFREVAAVRANSMVKAAPPRRRLTHTRCIRDR